MVKIWGKIYKDNRIIKSFTLTKFVNMEWSDFFDYTHEICENLDIPTPVIIKTHLFNYAKFNIVTFRASDFVESINFDKLVLENINR